jgi:TolB-like protein
MTQKTNSLERFWHELKRRKVIHVITVYAAVSFVILQLVDIVAEPLRLPDSTKALVIVLLCIGFIIAVLLSWVYDITPAGVKKTKPVSELKHVDQTTHAVSSGWKIATYVSGAIIVALVAFNFINKRNLNSGISKLEKSIAVLPFINDSPVDSNKYFINGIMEEVLNNLQKIKDFRVLSRTSTDQYKGSDRPTIPEIAKKLGVNYIVEGSGQKYGNTFILRVQLIAANKEKHLWGESYEKEIKEVRDYIMIPSQIAQSIAAGVKASMTPEEKRLIEKVPTSNMAAYDLYLKAEDYLKEYKKTRNISYYQTAVAFYKAVLEIDSAFAKAYTGLASAYYERYQWETYFRENYLDSMLVLINKAYTIDNELDEVYYLKGVYDYQHGQPEKALDNFDKSLKINPNYFSAYEQKGYILTWILYDFVRSIDNYYKALNLIRGDERVGLFQNLGMAYMNAGFTEKAKDYFEQALIQNGDSATYFSLLGSLEFSKMNLENAILLKEKAKELDPAVIPSIELYSFAGQDQKAYSAAEKEVERLKKSGSFPLQYSHRIGYAYWKVGKKSEARYYFNMQIKYGEESIHLGREYALNRTAHYDLAGVYAFLEDTVKAYQYLEELNKTRVYPLGGISYLRYDKLFDNIRNEERFQKTLNNIEAKYRIEHELAKKWLEEQGML